MIGSTAEGREQLRLAGWKQPHAEIYRLVAVPNDETMALLMQVPQPVYTGVSCCLGTVSFADSFKGSWTPNFHDAELVNNVVKSARQERVLSARNAREVKEKKLTTKERKCFVHFFFPLQGGGACGAGALYEQLQHSAARTQRLYQS